MLLMGEVRGTLISEPVNIFGLCSHFLFHTFIGREYWYSAVSTQMYIIQILSLHGKDSDNKFSKSLLLLLLPWENSAGIDQTSTWPDRVYIPP